MNEEREYQQLWMKNRDRKLAPKQGKFWCWGCDCCLIRQWKKCPVCGTRNGSRKNKR